MGRGILPIYKQECFLLKREAKPTAKGCWDRGSSSEAATWASPLAMLGFPALSGAPPRRERASARGGPRPSRTAGKEPRGVTAASSGSRCPTLALPRLPASPRGTPGRRATPTRPAASEGRVHPGATAHLGPRALRAGPRGLHPSPGPEQRPPRLTRVPGGGCGPRNPPRLAARRVTHILAAAVAAAASSRGSADSCGERPRLWRWAGLR